MLQRNADIKIKRLKEYWTVIERHLYHRMQKLDRFFFMFLFVINIVRFSKNLSTLLLFGSFRFVIDISTLVSVQFENKR